MLSDELRRTLAVARGHVAEGAMTWEVWDLFCERIEDVAGRLEQWERSAEIGRNPRRATLPDSVVCLADYLEQRLAEDGAPPGGDAA